MISKGTAKSLFKSIKTITHPLINNLNVYRFAIDANK